MAEQSNREGWPAQRFLGTLLEHEMAERETRRLARARVDSQLPPGKSLSEFDRFDLLVLDDFSCAKRDQAEASVLFELISERYERKSIAITANAPFSDWVQEFPDKAMTVAAVDRLVHHATILEMNVQSYRRRAALLERRQRSAPAEQ
jgi:DNA replication protein DnaC